ncbi:MAG: hypothetical protein WCP20_00670 [Desulfuromonadales bacterium]
MDESSSRGELSRTGRFNASHLISVLFVIVAMCLLLYGSSSQNRMQDVFGKTTYYILWIMFLVWIVQCSLFLESIAFSWKTFLRDVWPVMLLALILTIITAVTNHPKLRVLSDETNLASISRSMIDSKTVFNYTIGKNYYFTFNPIIAELDKRTMLFPFFVHFLHIIRGYAVNNLFLFNLMLHFTLLSSVGILVRHTYNRINDQKSNHVWIAAVILVFLCPILTLTATSGGFDLLSACFLGWTFVVLGQFIQHQTTESFAFLWMNLLLLAHTRYESFVFSVIIIAGLLFFRRLDKQLFIRFSHVYLVTPLALVPLVFQRILCRSKFEQPPGVDAFSAKHFIANIRHFFEVISDTTFFFPYPGLLLWLCLILIPFLLSAFLRRTLLSDNTGHRQLVYIVLGCLSVYLLIVFSYYFGDPRHPTAARFFVLPVVAMALAPIIAHRVWPVIFSQRLLLTGATGLLLLYFPVTSGDRFTQSLELIRETEHVQSFLEQLKNKNIFIVTDRPGIYTAFEYGASDFEYANKHKNELLVELKNNLYGDIIVIQHVAYSDYKPVTTQVLDSEFILNPPLAEYQITGSYFLRISKINKLADMAAKIATDKI